MQPPSWCKTLRMAETALREVLETSLPLPTWGDEFAQCRKRAHYTNQAAIEALKAIGLQVSTATLSRMEDREEVPDLLSQRILATAAMVLYRRDPALLSLDLDELPGTIYAALMDKFTGPDGGGDVANARSRCTAHQTSFELATVTTLPWSQLALREAA